MKISIMLQTRPLELLLLNGRRRFLVRPAMTKQQVVFMKVTQTFPHLTISVQRHRPALKVTVPVQPGKNLNQAIPILHVPSAWIIALTPAPAALILGTTSTIGKTNAAAISPTRQS